jgi:hypothetical protein
MLQVFLALIGVQHIRAFRFNAAKVNHFAKDASLSINEGSQSALVRGGETIQDQERLPIPNPAMSDLRPIYLECLQRLIGHRRRQGIAQRGSRSGTCGCAREKFRAARGSVFSNELRTTRSTLKQAFSSRNVSIFAW